jgi:hypothetical protein
MNEKYGSKKNLVNCIAMNIINEQIIDSSV